MNKLLNNLLGMYKQAKLNKKAEEVVYDSDLIAQVLSMTKNQKEDEFSIVTLSPEKDKVLGVKYIKKDEVYDYKPNQNEYALVMTRDTGFADTDYQLQPMSMVVRSWNEGRKFYATKKNRLNKKAEEDLIEVGWGLGTNTEEEIKDNAEWGDSDNPRETDKTFWDKINKDIENVENAFLKDGYKQFFTKVRDEGHHMDGVLGGTAWMTKEQLKDFIERAENYGGEEYVLSESSGSLDLKSPIDYDESIMFSVYVYVDEETLDNLNIEAKRVSKNKKLSSEKTRKSLHKKAISGFSADVMEINERKLDEIRNTAKDMGDEIWARINENIVKIIAYGYEDGKLKIVYREPYYGKEEIEEMYENADEVSLADFQTLELQREAKISHNLSKKAGWKVLTPKDLTEEVKDEFLKDSIKEYAGHVKREDFYFVKGIKEKEDDQFSYEWEEGMFGEWGTNVKGEKWYSLTDLGDDWDYIYLIKEDKLYKMPNRESLTDFGVVSSKAKDMRKKAFRKLCLKRAFHKTAGEFEEMMKLKSTDPKLISYLAKEFGVEESTVSQYIDVSENAEELYNILDEQANKYGFEWDKFEYDEYGDRIDEDDFRDDPDDLEKAVEYLKNNIDKSMFKFEYVGEYEDNYLTFSVNEKLIPTEPTEKPIVYITNDTKNYDISFFVQSQQSKERYEAKGIQSNDDSLTILIRRTSDEILNEIVNYVNVELPKKIEEQNKKQSSKAKLVRKQAKYEETVQGDEKVKDSAKSFGYDIKFAGHYGRWIYYYLIDNKGNIIRDDKEYQKVYDEMKKRIDDDIDINGYDFVKALIEEVDGELMRVPTIVISEYSLLPNHKDREENTGLEEFKRDFNLSSSTKKQATIKHENGVYNVYSESGKCLGKGYKTKEEAEKRLKQVEYFKHKSSLKQVVISKMAKIKK